MGYKMASFRTEMLTTLLMLNSCSVFEIFITMRKKMKRLLEAPSSDVGYNENDDYVLLGFFSSQCYIILFGTSLHFLFVNIHWNMFIQSSCYTMTVCYDS